MRMILTCRTDIRCWILMDLMERIEGEGESKLIWKYLYVNIFWLHLFLSDPVNLRYHIWIQVSLTLMTHLFET